VPCSLWGVALGPRVCLRLSQMWSAPQLVQTAWPSWIRCASRHAQGVVRRTPRTYAGVGDHKSVHPNLCRRTSCAAPPMTQSKPESPCASRLSGGLPNTARLAHGTAWNSLRNFSERQSPPRLCQARHASPSTRRLCRTGRRHHLEELVSSKSQPQVLPPPLRQPPPSATPWARRTGWPRTRTLR